MPDDYRNYDSVRSLYARRIEEAYSARTKAISATDMASDIAHLKNSIKPDLTVDENGVYRDSNGLILSASIKE